MRTISFFGAFLLLCAYAFGQSSVPVKDSASGAAQPGAASLPHDRHGGLSVSADSYVDAIRAKEKFGKADPVPAGILPVEVFLSNETNLPIHIDLSTIQLVVRPPEGRRQDIDSLAPAEVAYAIAHPEGAPAPHGPRFPTIGIHLSNDKKADQLTKILQPLSLDADIVPPMGAIHGFLFFNLSRDMTLAENASLYLPDAAIMPLNKPLMFFEVSLGKAPDR